VPFHEKGTYDPKVKECVCPIAIYLYLLWKQLEEKQKLLVLLN
jgi:hypothetical protein